MHFSPPLRDEETEALQISNKQSQKAWYFRPILLIFTLNQSTLLLFSGVKAFQAKAHMPAIFVEEK
jgi:hypothetical protein